MPRAEPADLILYGRSRRHDSSSLRQSSIWDLPISQWRKTFGASADRYRDTSFCLRQAMCINRLENHRLGESARAVNAIVVARGSSCDRSQLRLSPPLAFTTI